MQPRPLVMLFTNNVIYSSCTARALRPAHSRDGDSLSHWWPWGRRRVKCGWRRSYIARQLVEVLLEGCEEERESENVRM